MADGVEKKMAELEERIKKPDEEFRGETWNPKPGDVLVGTVVAHRELEVSGRQCQLIVVKTRAGDLKTVWRTKALNELFERVKVGDVVAIKYLGERQGKHGLRPYKAYKWEIA